MKMGEPVQLQTVLPRNGSRSSNAKLSKIDDHGKNIDQMIRTRNFQVGMKGLRQEYWSRVTDGEKSASKGKEENAISGKQLDSGQDEALAVSATEVIVDNKHNRLLIHRRRHRLTEEDLRKVLAPGDKVFLD